MYTVEQWEAHFEAEAKKRGVTVAHLWALQKRADWEASPEGLLDRAMRDVREDMRRGAYRGIHAGNSSHPPRPAVVVQPRAATRPLEPPPGIKIMDAMLDEEDKQWRADRAKQFGLVKPYEGDRK
jgi:hypothetical protein